MLKNNINKISELQDLLDSDDELPTNYKEKPDLPAYLDDERFDPIQFNWIKNNKIQSILATSASATTPALVVRAPPPGHAGLTMPSHNCGERTMIIKGILNEQDILCMRSVAARTTDDSVLLWFINFLMYKDLQAEYTFLKSCLVIKHENCGSTRKTYSQIFFPPTLSNCFELIVK